MQLKYKNKNYEPDFKCIFSNNDQSNFPTPETCVPTRTKPSTV